jgi:hypothetical protein
MMYVHVLGKREERTVVEQLVVWLLVDGSNSILPLSVCGFGIVASCFMRESRERSWYRVDLLPFILIVCVEKF